MLTYDKVKHAIHDGMTSRGYSPNPADIHTIATKVMELSKEAPTSKVDDDDDEPESRSKPSKR